MKPVKKDHGGIAHQYALDVTSGKIWVCKWVVLACQRFLDDLKRQSSEGFPYRYDAEKGNKVCRFAECFHVFEGPLAGQNINLMPWQCFLIHQLHGWVIDGGERDGKRRFRRCYLEVPRGNAKSSLGAILALHAAFADGEGGAQVVSAGTSKEVAKISLNQAQEMCRREPEFMKALGVEVLAHLIVQRKTASKFNAISADSKTSDGKNLQLCLFDEAWAFKDRSLYDSLETGTGKRDQSCMLVCTTAGFNTASVAYELRTYLCKILEKQHVDESTLGIIYCAPEGHEDDWTNPKVWEAANPGYNVTVMPEIIAQLAEKARVTPSAINNLKVKHLCLWVSADQAWMDMTKWREMHDDSLKIEDFRGEPCYLGLDLATVSDICAKAYIFMRMVDNKQHYYLFCQSYLPENALAFGNNSQAKGWEHQGLLTVTQGDVTDFSEIEADLLKDKADYTVRGVGYDPWGALQLAQRMTAEGLNMVEVPMRTKNISAPMKELDSLIRQGRLHHNNAVLDWCIGNVSVMPDRNDNIFFRKQKPQDKIDLAVASVLALALAMEYGLLPKRSVYEDRGTFNLNEFATA